MSESPLPVTPVESITSRIFLIRGQKVINVFPVLL